MKIELMVRCHRNPRGAQTDGRRSLHMIQDDNGKAWCNERDQCHRALQEHLGMLVFDDPRVGLVQEPFVAGADTMIDRVVPTIPDAERGFTLIFSNGAFPGHQIRLEWRRTDGSGNWYYAPDLDMEGWLCPALLRYFSEAPKEIYVQVKAATPKSS